MRPSFATEGSGEETKKDCLAPLEDQMMKLEGLLGSADTKELAISHVKIAVKRFMTAATNCPVQDASLQVQGRVCQLLMCLSEGVPLAPGKKYIEKFDKDVTSSGGLELAARL